MTNRWQPTSAGLAQSLKVAAAVMVLGWAILAAEQRLAQDASPEEIVAAETVPALVAASSTHAETNTARAALPPQTASR